MQNAQNKFQQLTAQLNEMLQEVSDVNPSQSPTHRIYYDFVKNHGHHPNGRQYSLETLIRPQ
jgi:hypothetical protein